MPAKRLIMRFNALLASKITAGLHEVVRLRIRLRDPEHAVAHFADHGIIAIEPVMTDRHWSDCDSNYLTLRRKGRR
jgi:hypothetical protein